MGKSRSSKNKGIGLVIGQIKEYKPYNMPNRLIQQPKPNRMMRRLKSK